MRLPPVPPPLLLPSSSAAPRRHLSILALPPFSLLPPHPFPSHIRQAHAQLILLGHASSRAAVSHLLAFCATSSPRASPHYAQTIFARIDLPNVFATNNFIRCLPDPCDAFAVYSAMRRRGTPTNNYTFPFVLEACARDEPSLFLEGLQVHGNVVRLGHDGDLFVRNGLVHFYGACHRMVDARKVFDEFSGRRDIVTWNAIIAGYAKDGRIGDCEKLFDEMPQRDSISWSTMIMGYVQSGFLEKGIMFFKQMMESKVEVNEATLVMVLSAAAQLGLLEYGEFMHRVIKRVNFAVTLPIGTALVDMYAKCGCIEMSRHVFDRMPERDVFAWNSMICGLAAHGLGMEALELFDKFIEQGLLPTNVTFVGALNACGRAGLVAKGRQFFESMVEEYGIEPEMEHYGCMVDLLGRAGLVSEAVNFIDEMKISPDPVLWGTLLAACKVHGLTDLGEKIGNKLIELEPAHDGHYVLLSGIYAKARKWDDVAKVRRLMSRQGTSKAAGWSLIESQGKSHKFVAGDRDHPLSKDIHDMNELVLRRLAEVGYSPDVSQVLHDIGEEEKFHAIKEHSERLAIAFGLLVIVADRPIRVVKNLRVCWDCHEVSKLISKVFEREIIVRDGSRFHHFKEGSCSCQDYW